MRRRLLVLLAVAVALACAGAMSGVAWLGSSAGNRWLKGELERRVSAAVAPGRLEIGGLRTDVLGHLELRELRLADRQGIPAVTVDAAVVDYRLWALLAGRVQVERLELRGPAVEMRAGPDGSSPLERALPGGEPSQDAWGGLPVDLRVSELRVVGGSIRMGDASSPVELRELDLVASVQGFHRRLRVEGLELSGELSGPAELSFSSKGGLAYDGDRLSLPRLSLVLGGSSAALRGAVRRLEGDDPVLDLELAGASLDLDELDGLLGDPGLCGSVSLRGSASGRLSELDLVLGADTGAGSLSVEAGGDFRWPGGAWSADVDLSELHLERLAEAVDEPTILDGSLQLDGRGLADPSVAGRLELGPGMAWGQPFDSAGARLSFRDGALRVDGFGLSSPVGSAELSGVLDGDGVEATLALRATGLSAAGISGRAGVSGRLAMPWGGDLAFDGRLAASRIQVGEDAWMEDASGPVHLVWGEGVLRCSGRLAAAAAGGGGARIERPGADWRLAWPSGRFDAQVLAGGLALGGMSVGSVRGRVSGGPDGWRALLEIRDYRLGQLAGDRGRVELSRGDEGLEAVLVLLDGERTRLGIRGRSDPRLGTFSFTDLVVAPRSGAAWRSAGALGFRWTGDGVEDLSVDLVSDAGELSARGRLGITGPQDASIELSGFRLGWLGLLFPELAEGWRGRIDGELRIAGTAAAPELRGELDVSGVGVPGIVSGLGGRLVLSSDGRRVVLDAWPEAGKRGVGAVHLDLPLAAGAPGVVLRRDDVVSASVKLGPVHSRRLARLVPALAGMPPGAVAAELAAAGDVADPRIDLDLGLDLGVGPGRRQVRLDVSVERRPGGRISGQVVGLVDGVRRLVLSASAADRVAGILGALLDGGPLPEPSSWVDDMEVRVLPLGLGLADLAALAGVDLPAEGSLSGGVIVEGSPSRPRVSGGVQVIGGRFGGTPFSPAVFSLAPEGGGYHVEARLGFRDGFLDLAGFVPLAPGTGALAQGAGRASGLDVVVRGRGLPVALLSDVDPGLEDAAGTLDVSGRIGGSLAEPEPTLDIAVDGASWDYRPLGIAFSRVLLAARLRGRELLIDRFAAATAPAGRRERESDGRIECAGSVGLGRDGVVHLGLAIVPQHAWLSDTSSLALRLSGALAVAGDWPEPRVRGQLSVERAHFRLDRSDWLREATLRVDPALHFEGRRVAEGTVTEPGSWERWDLDFGVELEDPAEVEVTAPLDTSYGDLSAALSTVRLDAWLEGGLRVLQQGGPLELAGELETRRGKVTVLGRDFELSEGRVRFPGGVATNPYLDVTAVHHTRGYGDVSVRIAGEVDAGISPAFASEEGWSDTDIAALLLLGRPASELTRSEGNARNDLVGAVVGAMTQQAEQIGGGSLVDLLEVSGSEEGVLGALKVGWEIGGDLFLTLAFDPEAEAGENVSETTLEWRLGRSLQAELTTGDRGASSVDLFWRLRF